uniref:Uncharacterized protein n=1 Tax=Lotharella oceanica TaxID=641309 RepID=A0A7S2XFE4_9EUKA
MDSNEDCVQPHVRCDGATGFELQQSLAWCFPRYGISMPPQLRRLNSYHLCMRNILCVAQYFHFQAPTHENFFSDDVWHGCTYRHPHLPRCLCRCSFHISTGTWVCYIPSASRTSKCTLVAGRMACTREAGRYRQFGIWVSNTHFRTLGMDLKYKWI